MDPAIAAELAALEEDLAALKGRAADMAAALEVASAASERTARLQDEIDRLASGEVGGRGGGWRGGGAKGRRHVGDVGRGRGAGWVGGCRQGQTGPLGVGSCWR